MCSFLSKILDEGYWKGSPSTSGLCVPYASATCTQEVTCAWPEYGWALPLQRHRLEREGQAVCVYTNTYILNRPHFFLERNPTTLLELKTFVFIYHQLVRGAKYSAYLISGVLQPEAEFDKSTYPPRKKAQSHPEGALGNHANGREWKTQEKVQGLCLVPWTNRCGTGVTSMLTVALQRQQNLEMAQCLSVQDLIDGLRWGINNEILFNL